MCGRGSLFHGRILQALLEAIERPEILERRMERLLEREERLAERIESWAETAASEETLSRFAVPPPGPAGAGLVRGTARLSILLGLYASATGFAAADLLLENGEGVLFPEEVFEAALQEHLAGQAGFWVREPDLHRRLCTAFFSRIEGMSGGGALLPDHLKEWTYDVSLKFFHWAFQAGRLAVSASLEASVGSPARGREPAPRPSGFDPQRSLAFSPPPGAGIPFEYHRNCWRCRASIHGFTKNKVRCGACGGWFKCVECGACGCEYPG